MANIKFRNTNPNMGENELLHVCEPFPFSCSIEVPSNFDEAMKQCVKVELWTDLCDITHKNNEWHSVEMRLIRCENCILYFGISIFVIKNGKFGMTMRLKYKDDDYIWSGDGTNNIAIISLPLQLKYQREFTLDSVEHFVQWYNLCLKYITNEMANSTSTTPSASPLSINSYSSSNYGSSNSINEIKYIRSFTCSFVGLICLDVLNDVAVSDSIVQLLLDSKHLTSSSACKRIILYFIGSSYITNSLFKKICDYVDEDDKDEEYDSYDINENNFYTNIKDMNTLRNAMNSFIDVIIKNKFTEISYSNNLSKNGKSNDIKPTIKDPHSSSNNNELRSRTLSKLPGQSMPNLCHSSSISYDQGNSCFYELLIDLIKYNSCELFSHRNIEALMNLLITTDDSMIHLYVYKTLRYLYDKPPTNVNGKLYSLTSFILEILTSMFRLHEMTMREMKKNQFRYEGDYIMDGKEVSPLYSLLKLLTKLLDPTPKYLSSLKTSSVPPLGLGFNSPQITPSFSPSSNTNSPPPLSLLQYSPSPSLIPQSPGLLNSSNGNNNNDDISLPVNISFNIETKNLKRRKMRKPPPMSKSGFVIGDEDSDDDNISSSKSNNNLEVDDDDDDDDDDGIYDSFMPAYPSPRPLNMMNKSKSMLPMNGDSILNSMMISDSTNIESDHIPFHKSLFLRKQKRINNNNNNNNNNLYMQQQQQQQVSVKEQIESQIQTIQDDYNLHIKELIHSLLGLVYILDIDNNDYKKIIEILKNLCSKQDKLLNFIIIEYITKHFPKESTKSCSLLRLLFSAINEFDSPKPLIDKNLGPTIIKRVCKCIRNTHVDVIATALNGIEPYSNNIFWGLVNGCGLKIQIVQYVKSAIESNLDSWYNEIKVKTKNILDLLHHDGYL